MSENSFNRRDLLKTTAGGVFLTGVASQSAAGFDAEANTNTADGERVLIVRLEETERYEAINNSNSAYINKTNRYMQTSEYEDVVGQLQEFGSLCSPTRRKEQSEMESGGGCTTLEHYIFFLNAVVLEAPEEHKTQIDKLPFVKEVWWGDKPVPMDIPARSSERGNFDSNTQALQSGEVNPKEYWENLIEQNWGYEATGLDLFHKGYFNGSRGEDINITIIDSGFDMDHPLHNPVVDSKARKDYHVNVAGARFPAELGFGSYDDSHGHGTETLGTVWQAAPNANYYVVKTQTVFDSPITTTSMWLGHIDFAKEVDSDVITTQITEGCGNPLVEPDDGSHEVSKALSEAADEDTVVTASAGNSATSGFLEILSGCGYPAVPSTGEDVISVSSTSQDTDILASQGNISTDASPDNTYANKPDVAAPGATVATMSLGGEETFKSGSSFAAPHVAGIAALLQETASPNNANDIREALAASAVNIEGTDLDGEGWVDIVGAYGHETLTEAGESPDPNIEIVDITASDEGAEFRVELGQNIDTATASGGVHLNFDGAEVQSVNLGGFDRCMTGGDNSVSGCGTDEGVDSGVLELYVSGERSDSGNIAISGTIDVTFTDGENAKVSHRAWIRQRDATTYNPYAKAYERYIARSPTEGDEIDPKNPEAELQENPPFARASYDSDFDITEYPTEETFIGPDETSVAVSPETWDLGSIAPGETYNLDVTVENTGEVSSVISISSGSGLSASGVPTELGQGSSETFTVTLEADDYDGDSITISYAGGVETIPISTALVRDDNLIEEDDESIRDPHNCIFILDVWGPDKGLICDGEESVDWVDDVSLDEEVLNGFVEATLYVEFATDPNQDAQDDPLEVYINNEHVSSLESPPGGGEFETRSVEISESVLQVGDNEVKLTTSWFSGYQIGSDTELVYSYFEEPDLDLSFGEYPDEVEPGTTFVLPVTVENDGGQSAEDVQLGISSRDEALTVVQWPETFGPSDLVTLEPGELDTGYFVFELEKNTTASGEIAAVADNIDSIDWPDRSFTVEAPNEDPRLKNHDFSPSDVYPDEAVTYTADIIDPDDSSVEVTLEIYIPHAEMWQTMTTQEIDGSGEFKLTENPFDGEDIGDVGQYRFQYEDDFGNSGMWGPFTGPSITDPNPEGPTFDEWEYPTVVAPGDDIKITVSISDSAGVASAQLDYTYPNGTTGNVTMTESGGAWIATLPSPTEDDVDRSIRFTIAATDDHEFSKTSESATRSIVVEDSEPDITDYTNEEGTVDTDGLRDAVDDWRAGDIDTELLRDVVDAWRSGDEIT